MLSAWCGLYRAYCAQQAAQEGANTCVAAQNPAGDDASRQHQQ
jgi:hypothetical protein